MDHIRHRKSPPEEQWEHAVVLFHIGDRQHSSRTATCDKIVITVAAIMVIIIMMIMVRNMMAMNISMMMIY